MVITKVTNSSRVPSLCQSSHDSDLRCHAPVIRGCFHAFQPPVSPVRQTRHTQLESMRSIIKVASDTLGDLADVQLIARQQRNQARELVRQFRAGTPEALARWDAHFDRRPDVLQLAHAQAVLAREAGFPSWPRLKAHVEAPRFVRRPRGPKKLPSFRRLELLYAYTLELVERDDPAALTLQMPPGGWYGRTIAVLLRENVPRARDVG